MNIHSQQKYYDESQHKNVKLHHDQLIWQTQKDISHQQAAIKFKIQVKYNDDPMLLTYNAYFCFKNQALKMNDYWWT